MARADFRYKSELRVRFGETDLQGVVYNAEFLAYFDAAQADYFRHLGVPLGDMRERGHDVVIVDISVQFLAPAHFDEMIEVFTRISDIGDSSMKMDYEVYEKESGRSVAASRVAYVIVNPETGRPVHAPAYLRAAVRNFEENTEIEAE
ncbi:MAG: thioesterase family protein [bacterium]